MEARLSYLSPAVGIGPPRRGRGGRRPAVERHLTGGRRRHGRIGGDRVGGCRRMKASRSRTRGASPPQLGPCRPPADRCTRAARRSHAASCGRGSEVERRSNERSPPRATEVPMWPERPRRRVGAVPILRARAEACPGRERASMARLKFRIFVTFPPGLSATSLPAVWSLGNTGAAREAERVASAVREPGRVRRGPVPRATRSTCRSTSAPCGARRYLEHQGVARHRPPLIPVPGAPGPHAVHDAPFLPVRARSSARRSAQRHSTSTSRSRSRRQARASSPLMSATASAGGRPGDRTSRGTPCPTTPA